MSSTYGCFSLPIKGLSIRQYDIYKKSWNTFDKIQSYNAQVSTLIGLNPTASVSYWRFANGDEKGQYIQGQYLHQQAYPGSNFNSIG
jgi:hypothetical protein